MLATASHPEPSTNAPCTRTTFLMPVGGGGAAAFRVVCSGRVAPITAAVSATRALSFFITILPSRVILGLVCLSVFIGFCPFLIWLSLRPACHGPQSVTRESPVKMAGCGENISIPRKREKCDSHEEPKASKDPAVFASRVAHGAKQR